MSYIPYWLKEGTYPYSNQDVNNCYIDKTGGITHSYRSCIKDTDQILSDFNQRNCKRVDCAMNIGKGFLSYLDGLTFKGSKILDDKCENKIGNSYFSKTNRKCKYVKDNPCSGEPVYEYVDNASNYNILTGRRNKDIGVLPSAVSSLTQIKPGKLLTAITKDTESDCLEIHAKCHVVGDRLDYNKGYIGWSRPTCVDKNNYSNISNTKKQLSYKQKEHLGSITESFENIDEKEFNNNILVKSYYLLLSLILIYIIFKIIHKKK